MTGWPADKGRLKEPETVSAGKFTKYKQFILDQTTFTNAMHGSAHGEASGSEAELGGTYRQCRGEWCGQRSVGKPLWLACLVRLLARHLRFLSF